MTYGIAAGRALLGRDFRNHRFVLSDSEQSDRSTAPA
jgi:hypothetical protein